jgi:Macrocin-O-methyltransferase (TylF)
MRRLLKVPMKSLALTFYRSKPISAWPKWTGDLLEISIPANLPRKAALSPAGGSNINIILSLLDRTRDVPGDVAECGVFRGNSLAAIALYLNENRLAKHVFGLDSFQGFNGSVQKDIDLGGAVDSEKRVGGFRATSLAHVESKLAGLRLQNSVSLIPGYFADTLEQLLNNKFSFVHLDCDIYESYLRTLQFFYPRLSPGGIILFDEYDDPPWPGCKLAVDEFLADKPEKPVTMQKDNYQKYFIQTGGHL